MLYTITILTALCGQAPDSGVVASAEKQKAMLAAIRAKTAAPEIKAQAAAEKRRREIVSAENMARHQAGAIRSRTAGYRAHNAQVAREVAAMEAQQRAILAEQARQYRADLPFMLEMRRQNLNRQSDIERNAILNRALNGTGYVPPVNLTPQPVDNGNRMPLP